MKQEEKEDDFYVGYIDSVSPNTKKSLKSFVHFGILLLVGGALIFAFSQNTFKNSTFELATSTKITGVYHEMPYPMLRVKTGDTSFKNILLLGFGKSSANPFLQKIRNESGSISGSVLSIEGNLIYYNGKTLLQITSDEKVSLVENAATHRLPKTRHLIRGVELKGEIIDPKCYFGVMKPGKGKIHRSCAALCISGGIPPVLATSDENNISEYYLLTDKNGNPINEQILPYIGKPSILTGDVVQIQDWYQLRINTEDIKDLDLPSKIY